MFPSTIRVKPALAAKIASVNYECSRTWLKRGLLKNTGRLAQFYAAEQEAKINDTKRWTWSSFGIVELYVFRLTKVLLDYGFSWNFVSNAVNDIANEFWSEWHSELEPNNGGSKNKRYLAVFPDASKYTTYSLSELSNDIRKGCMENESLVIVDLYKLRQNVIERIKLLC